MPTLESLPKRLQHSQYVWIALLVWIGAIACLTLFWGLGDIGLIDETEPLFVEAARQMDLTRDWITPYFNGETRFDKPPLIYWLMVVCFRGFGVHEWAARLPSVLSATAITGFCAWVLHQHQPLLNSSSPFQTTASRRPWLAPWLGATVLLLNLNTFFWGRTGYADMLLTACMGGALLAFFMGYAQPNLAHQRRWYWLFYGLTALGILTKGPIAILLPALIIGLFAVYLGQLKAMVQELQLVRGLALVLVLTLPWYILVTLANGEAFIDSFFGYHNMERFTHVVNQHSGPWYFHFLVILIGFLPWSAYLPAALFKLRPWQRRQWQERSRSEQLGLYAGIWFVVILGFFTVSVTKYFSYTLPLLPAAAILVSLLWTEALTQSPTQRPSRWAPSRWFNVTLLGVLSWALFACPAWLQNDPWMPTLGENIAASGIPGLGGLLWFIAADCAILCILARSNALWWVNTAAVIVLFGAVLHPAVQIVDQARQAPLRAIAQDATAAQRPGEELVTGGFWKPSLVFYAQQPITFIEDPQKLVPYLAQSPAPGHLIITTPKLLNQSGLPTTHYERLGQQGIFELLREQRSPAG